MMHVSRREFLAAATAVGTSVAINGTAAALNAKGPWVCAFSKHLQFITDYKNLAKTAKALGLDGLDLAVRKGGHVEPANASVDLPRAVDAVRGEGLDVYMITTNLLNGDDPDAKPILDAAAKLGIRYARVGNHLYSKNGDIQKELAGFAQQMVRLVKQSEAHGMILGYHNHSGDNQVGAALWDLHRMIEIVNSPRTFGSNFDTGHAAVEGGLGVWRINARLMAPHVKMMSVKDFVWENKRVKWVPLGEGQTQTAEMLEIIRKAGFEGPISMHFEYQVPSNDAMLEEIRKAAVTLRDELKKAGYAPSSGTQ